MGVDYRWVMCFVSLLQNFDHEVVRFVSSAGILHIAILFLPSRCHALAFESCSHEEQI